MTPPSSLWPSDPKEPSVRRTAAAPEPPVRVATDLAYMSMEVSSSMRSIMMSLISRAVSQEVTSPARDLAEFDLVGDFEDAVEDAEAGVGDVVDGFGAADAEFGGDAAGGGGFEVFAVDAGVDDGADVVGGDVGGGDGFFAGFGGALGQGGVFFPPAAFADTGEGFELADGHAALFVEGCKAFFEFFGGDDDGGEFVAEGVYLCTGVFHGLRMVSVGLSDLYSILIQ